MSLTLADPDGGATVSGAGLVVHVRDDYDGGIFSFGVAEVEAEEGATISVPIQRAGSSGSATLTITVTGDAGFTTPDGPVLSFGDGQTSARLSLSIADDSIYKINSVLTLKLACSIPGAPNYCDSQTESVAHVRVLDNGDAGTFSLVSQNVSVTEDQGTVELVVRRADGSSGHVSFDYSTRSGLASAGPDFVPASGTKLVPDGEADATIVVELVDDGIFESTENFWVDISTPTNGSALGSWISTEIVIADDFDCGTLSFEVEAMGVFEGVPFEVVVTRDGGTSGSTSADINETPGSECGIGSVTIEFIEGQAQATATMVAVDDDAYESPRACEVVLTQLGPSPVSDAALQIELHDDGDAGTVSFRESLVRTREDAGDVRISFSRTGGSSSAGSPAFIVETTARGSATPVTDFVPAHKRIVLAEGQLDAFLLLSLVDDDMHEVDETIVLNITGTEGGLQIGPQQQLEIVIEDARDGARCGDFTNRTECGGTAGSACCVWLEGASDPHQSDDTGTCVTAVLGMSRRCAQGQT